MKSRFSILLVLLLFGVALSACSGRDTQPDVGVQEAIDTYARPEVLVDTAWVLEHLVDATVHLIDVGSNQEAFVEGHLPGAQFVSLGADLTNPNDAVRGQILSREALSDLMGRLGVTNDDSVVFYDNASNLLAARAYWVLKYYQHDDVRIYNGGIKKWTAEGHELTAEITAATPTNYVSGEADPTIRTNWQYVVDHTDDPSTLFCDARSPEEYAGTDVRSERGGHIPGAINVEWGNAVNQDGTFREASALADLYTKAGFARDKEVITYCQTGVRGAHTWFVLRELLGYPDVRNYDGSWEEYGNNSASPIEQ
jgi:thiosulfate/3-mercaptopyruvate sulfurtransferase